MLGQLLRRLASPWRSSAVFWVQPGNRFLNSKPQAAADDSVPELPEPWRSDFLPTLPVPEGHDSSTTAFSWLRKQQPHLSLAALGKAFRQKQVRVLQQGQVKRVSKSRALTSGDVLLLPKQFVQPDSSNSSDAAAHTTATAPCGKQQQAQQQHPQHPQQQQQQQHPQQQQQRPPKDSAVAQQQRHWQQEQRQEAEVAAEFSNQPPQQPVQQSTHQHIQTQQQTEPHPVHKAMYQQPQQQQELQLLHDGEQQQQQQQQQWSGSHRGPLTVPQIRRWVLASSGDVAVLLKPPGLLFGLPLAEGKPDTATDPSSGSGDSSDPSSDSSSRHDRPEHGSASEFQPTHAEQPTGAIWDVDVHPDTNNNSAPAIATGTDSAVFAQALNVQQPHQPQLVYQLSQGVSGALVLARHAGAASWLRAYVSGEPAALAAPVIAALGGLQAAQIAVRRSAKAAAAAAAGGGGVVRKKARQGRRRGQQAEQDKQVQKLQQLAALALDHRQGGGRDQQETHSSRSSSSNSSSGGNDAESTNISIVDPLACFDRRELLHWLRLYGEVGGLRLRRVFWAVVQGQLKTHQTGTLRDRCSSGLLCVTRFKVLASSPQGVSWLELQPLTDDADQIRRHCAQQLGAPVLGDTRFGYQVWPAAHASSWPRVSRTRSSRGASSNNMPSSSNQQAGASMDEESGQEGNLLLHAREVVLLRPSKPPVHVIAPLHRGMRSFLELSGLM